MTIVNKDAGKRVKDAGDILALFGTKAKVEVEITPAEKALAAGHAERIGTALAHVGRGVTVLQELMNLAARRRNPQTTPLGLAHVAPPAGPAAEQGGATPLRIASQEEAAAARIPKSLTITGEAMIDINAGLEALSEEHLGLEELKASIMDAARDAFVSKKELPTMFANARESMTAGVAADRGVVLRSEVNETIVQPVLSWARKAIENQLMVGKSLTPSGRKGRSA